MKEDFSFTSAQKMYFPIKRALDLIVTFFAIVPLLFLYLFVKLTYLFQKDNNPVIYKQTRIGKNGKRFEIYKFRTMNPDAEQELKSLLKNSDNRNEWEEYHKLKNDPRITPFGLFLRKSSLDEFPQFINVLKGEMSVIGPRPLVEGELQLHHGLPLYEKLRPGITGWWACNGRSVLAYSERLEYEYYYVRNVSFKLDLTIFFKTIISIIGAVGAQ